MCSTDCQPDKAADDVANSFTLSNSFWFVLVSLFKQGIEIQPRAFSTRLITAFWWMFALIMVSSYTANLAAFLIAGCLAGKFESPIESVEDLASQARIRYGTVHGGSTSAFFEQSESDIYARMWQYMDYDKNAMMSSAREGVDRVLKEDGNYAFITESSVVEYVV